jgi:hypothetical protein
MPLLDKKIPGWLKGAVAGMLLLTVGHFIHQTFFVGWREYQVLVFTDLPFGANEARYDAYLDGKYRKKTFFVQPAPGDTFGLYGAEPLRLPTRNVTLELVPNWPSTARQSYRFEIANSFESQINCDILVRLRSGVPTVEGGIYIDYDASNFAFFVERVN